MIHQQLYSVHWSYVCSMPRRVYQVISDIINSEYPELSDETPVSQRYSIGFPAPQRELLAETLYAKFLNKFGLPSIADVNIVGKLISIYQFTRLHEYNPILQILFCSICTISFK
jgi:hypothetical protein